MGGYPAAHLRASIGDEKNTISSDPKADHILDEISAEEITNPDGTVDVKKKFTLPVTNFFVFSSTLARKQSNIFCASFIFCDQIF